MSRAGRMATYEWQSIAEEFHDYLGALSVETPDLDPPEASSPQGRLWRRAGAVALRRVPPALHLPGLPGVRELRHEHDPGADAPEESVTPGEWIDALCPSVPSGQGQVARRGISLRPAEVRRAARWNARRRISPRH
ncbi:hypothetical protein LV779_34795 [Streptomyces thinghirensis]|nr:hypothetical protein [Streptomyces thinghirensis]